ncbi:SDR family oxidoreductase [Phenylobacterium sp.]|uniref:SDR family oxidoreductase n=1 Tax=Phenylobacterium sp. TaxID=1871053 RepID=UPI002EDB8C05
MRVFVTGATGWVGAAVIEELIASGHRVLGLTRSDSGAALLTAAGAEVHRGSLEDPDSLRQGAALAEGVVHTAFNHDFSRYAENSEMDRRAIEALGAALEGSDRPLLVTSELPFLASGGVATETDAFHPVPGPYVRQSEAAVDAVAARGVRAAAVRMPLSVHGEGDHGFVPVVINLALAKGVSAYPGDGLNRWPATHRRDVARIFRLALERGAAEGPYHAIGEEGVPFKAIAEVIGQRLNVPVVAISSEESADHFGWFAMFAEMNLPATSHRTRALLNWEPTEPGLLSDMEHAGYFAA